MKFELRVCYGERKNTLFQLASKVMQIGRSSAANVIIDWDPFVSPLHCRLEISDEGVVITDLGSSNGTRVNDERIKAPVKLTAQDFIQVGFTVLKIEQSEQPSEPALPSDLPRASGSTEPLSLNQVEAKPDPENASPPAPHSDSTEIRKSVSTYDLNRLHTFYASDVELLKHEQFEYSKLFQDKVRISGTLENEKSPSQVLSTFAHALPEPLFVLDFARLKEAERPNCDPEQCILFHWLAKDAALQLPCLYALSELPNWKALLTEHWGQDGILVLVSKHTKGKMLELLRKRLRYDVELPPSIAEKPDKDAGYGYCWPSVLVRLIEMNVEGFGSDFLADLEFLFCEKPGNQAGWLILGSKKLVAESAARERSAARESREQ